MYNNPSFPIPIFYDEIEVIFANCGYNIKEMSEAMKFFANQGLSIKDAIGSFANILRKLKFVDDFEEELSNLRLTKKQINELRKSWRSIV